jgi:hypothetical protein
VPLIQLGGYFAAGIRMKSKPLYDPQDLGLPDARMLLLLQEPSNTLLAIRSTFPPIVIELYLRGAVSFWMKTIFLDLSSLRKRSQQQKLYD